MLKKILKLYLRWWAIKILAKFKPRIVAITGSTGKTSTRDAIFTVLNSPDEKSIGLVAKTQANLNTEFGVTANIIDPNFTGQKVGDSVKINFNNLFDLTVKAIKWLTDKSARYPKILVLELAADRPGDIQWFMDFIKPEVGVLTNIGDVHLEFFGSKAELVEEKSLVVSNVSKTGLVILNKDDEFSKLIAKKTTAKKIYISRYSDADIMATNVGIGRKGLRFDALVNKKTIHIEMPVYGEQFVYAAETALAVGDYFGVNINNMVGRLQKYQLQPGRFERLELNKLILIDDTYNANPTSMLAALASLSKLGNDKRKVAILGDMRELGSAYDKSHQDVGRMAAKLVDLLIVVGGGGQIIKESAIKAGLPESKTFDLGVLSDFSKSVLMDKQPITDALSKLLRDNDIVLVKGSRAVKMDKIVELIKNYWKKHE